MTNGEMERRITAYKSRKVRFARAFADEATLRNSPPRLLGEKCAMCDRQEHGGGLYTFRLRDGDEIVVGGRCAEYVHYLRENPARARIILR